MNMFWVLAGIAILLAVVFTVSELVFRSAGPGDVYPP